MKTLKTFILSAVLGCLSFAYQAHSETDTKYDLSQGELEQILAPVALYPDTVLSHILIASTYPLEVIQAERWTRENPNLEGDKALQAAEKKDWDPSVIALVPFPQILQKMSENLDWMQKLGDAFLQNEELVLASIQELRQRAYEEGNLDNLEHLTVSREEDNIVIEPSVREVVYVPYYDTRVVYGNWWWADYPPVYWTSNHRHHYSGANFYWGPSIYVGTGFYFSSFHWHNRYVVVVDRHYAHRHHFYSGRQVVRHDRSRQWVHNTRHRRGVEYRHPNLRENHRVAATRQHRDSQQVSQRLQNHSRTGASGTSMREHINSRHGGTAENRAEASSRTRNPDTSRRINRPAENKWERSDTSKRTERSTPIRVENESRQTTPFNRQTIKTPTRAEDSKSPPTRVYRAESSESSDNNRARSTERSSNRSSRGTQRSSQSHSRQSRNTSR